MMRIRQRLGEPGLRRSPPCADIGSMTNVTAIKLVQPFRKALALLGRHYVVVTFEDGKVIYFRPDDVVRVEA